MSVSPLRSEGPAGLWSDHPPDGEGEYRHVAPCSPSELQQSEHRDEPHRYQTQCMGQALGLLVIPGHSPLLAEWHTGPKAVFPADHSSGCSRCQHPRQWGWGPAIPPAMASGQWQGGVCIPGGLGLLGVAEQAGLQTKKLFKVLVLAVLGQDQCSSGRAQAEPSEAAFPLLLSEGGHTHAAKQPQENAIGPLPKRHRRAGSPPAHTSSTSCAGGSLFPLPT